MKRVFNLLDPVLLKTLQESFKSLVITATQYKTDARIDGTIRASHNVGDRVIEPKATRQVQAIEC